MGFGQGARRDHLTVLSQVTGVKRQRFAFISKHFPVTRRQLRKAF